MSFPKLIATIFMSFVVSLATAGTINVPAKNAVITVNIPDSWEPEETDKGIAFESPDKVVTVFFEIAAPGKSLNRLIDENIDWLVTEQSVRINAATKKVSEVSVGGIQSGVVHWDADSKDYGPAKVGFIVTLVGNKTLLTTYWISIKGFQKQRATFEQIFESVKPVR